MASYHSMKWNARSITVLEYLKFTALKVNKRALEDTTYLDMLWYMSDALWKRICAFA